MFGDQLVNPGCANLNRSGATEKLPIGHDTCIRLNRTAGLWHVNFNAARPLRSRRLDDTDVSQPVKANVGAQSFHICWHWLNCEYLAGDRGSCHYDCMDSDISSNIDCSPAAANQARQ